MATILSCTSPSVSETLHKDMRMDTPLYMLQRFNATAKWSRGGRRIPYHQARKDTPIDLIGGEGWAWLDLSVIEALHPLTLLPDTEMRLDYQSGVYVVTWRVEDPPVISYDPVIDYNTLESTDKVCNVRFKFNWKIS